MSKYRNLRRPTSWLLLVQAAAALQKLSKLRKGRKHNRRYYFLSVSSLTPKKVPVVGVFTHMYIHRHPGRPLTPFSPACTPAMRKPENRGPTEVKT